MSQSIGKVLDELQSGKITKQQAVTKLQRQRNKYAAQADPKDPQAEIAEMMGWYGRDGGWFQPQAPDHWNKDNDLDVTNVMSGVLALFQAHQQQLLSELLGHKISIVTKDVGGTFVPVSVIKRKIGELNG